MFWGGFSSSDRFLRFSVFCAPIPRASNQDQKTMTARDATGFHAFSPPRFPRSFGNFSTLGVLETGFAKTGFVIDDRIDDAGLGFFH